MGSFVKIRCHGISITAIHESMSCILHVVDAFTDRPFSGNPAAVCLLEAPLGERKMQLIAREMNLSETAFLHPIESGWSLRWFTPTMEVKLCGHATLASAFTLWKTGILTPEQTAYFHTLSGRLGCKYNGNWIEMDFPSSHLESVDPNPAVEEALGVPIQELVRTDCDLLAKVTNETILRNMKPNMNLLAALPFRGICITSRSESLGFDFISRFFAPAFGIPEDPVTGSAHCALGPFWKNKMGKSDFTAFQASERGGIVKLSVQDNRILLQGQAVMVSRVELQV